ncbi:MAG: hypothetical protein ACRDYA_20805 [Egibacteraceae bacterium]
MLPGQFGVLPGPGPDAGLAEVLGVLGGDCLLVGSPVPLGGGSS